MIPYFIVVCYKDGIKVRSEVCMNVMEAEQRVSEYKEFDHYDKIRILYPGEHETD